MLLMAAVSLAGCAPTAAAAPSPAVSAPKVLAAETFLADIAQNVAGQRAVVATLLSAGVDPHEFQPTPRDAIKITQAQVLIVNGLGYETWLTKSMQGSGLLVVATDGLAPNPDPIGVHSGGDPHMWMNPLNVVHYVENIRDGLTRSDPAGAAAYASNAKAYIGRLTELDQWIRKEVGSLPPSRKLLVTNHDTLAYFSAAYGFRSIGAVIPSVTSEASPSAQQMAALIQTVRSSGAPAIFLDISENQSLARQIASESGAKVVTDLYFETLSAPDGPAPTYLEMLKHDVTVIVQALR